MSPSPLNEQLRASLSANRCDQGLSRIVGLVGFRQFVTVM